MSSHTTTTLAYVRTSAGVVRVDPGGDVPDDVDADELQRLTAAGTVVEIEVEVEAQVPAADPPPTPAPPIGGKGTRRGGKAS